MFHAVSSLHGAIFSALESSAGASDASSVFDSEDDLRNPQHKSPQTWIDFEILTEAKSLSDASMLRWSSPSQLPRLSVS